MIYRGSIANFEKSLTLDKHHVMEVGRVFPVCGNSYRILRESRFAPHFEFIGNFDRHYGIFPGCGTPVPFASGESADAENTPGCC